MPFGRKLAEEMARHHRGNSKEPATEPRDTWLSFEEVMLHVGTHTEFVR